MRLRLHPIEENVLRQSSEWSNPGIVSINKTGKRQTKCPEPVFFFG